MAIAPHTELLLRVLPLTRRTRVMDVGANPANRPDYADLLEAGGCEVHGFEPGEAAFALLDAARGPHEVYHPHAVGRGGAATFYACTNQTYSSLYAPDGAQVQALGHWKTALTVTQAQAVQTVALDEVANLPKPDMLKMDTQGAELEILEGGAQTLSEAVAIVPEVRFYRLYEGEPMLGAVDIKLREMGFMLHKFLPGAVLRLTSSRIDKLRPAMTRNQMVDADAIYIRDIARPKEMTNDQLGHMALLADACFGSVDLVLRCLDHLSARGAIQDDVLDAYVAELPRNFRKAD